MMIPASQVADLFDNATVGPSAGRLASVGGGYSDQQGEGMVYFPGGYAPSRGALNESLQAAGPMGLAQYGGYRQVSRLKRKTTRRGRGKRCNRGPKRRGRSRRR